MTCHYATSRVGPNMSFEDFIFWSYVDPSERPEGYSQKDNLKYDDVFICRLQNPFQKEKAYCKTSMLLVILI